MLASGLILASAFLHALWNALLKRDPEPRVQAMGILIVATAIAAAAIPFGQEPAFVDSRWVAWGLVSGVFEGAYFLSLALSFERAPLGLAYTVSRGGAMLLVWIVSAGFLGEAVTGLTLSGVVLVAAGLWLANHEPGRSWLSGARWPLACAACITGYHLCYQRALWLGASPPALFAVSLGVGIPLFMSLSGARTARAVFARFRSKPLGLVTGGVVCAASFLIFLTGLAKAGAGQAITLRNSSVVFAQGFALLIGEPFIAKRWIGAMLVALGAALIASGH